MQASITFLGVASPDDLGTVGIHKCSEEVLKEWAIRTGKGIQSSEGTTWLGFAINNIQITLFK